MVLFPGTASTSVTSGPGPTSTRAAYSSATPMMAFPGSMGVGIKLQLHHTPNALLLDGTTFTPGPDFAPLGYVITPDLLPGGRMVAGLGNGPGVHEVDTFTAGRSLATRAMYVSMLTAR